MINNSESHTVNSRITRYVHARLVYSATAAISAYGRVGRWEDAVELVDSLLADREAQEDEEGQEQEEGSPVS